jgi:hypothetical protein
MNELNTEIMINDKVLREIKFLKIYSVGLTFLLLFLCYLILKPNRKEHFEEISVGRINVVEKDGSLRLVISNSEKQHSCVINGKEIPERERAAGLIFFNSVGDECGGLIYDGNEKEAGLVFSVDKFRDDQVMQLQYMEDTKSKNRKYGVQLWDYPKENSFEARMKCFEELEKLKNKDEIQKAYDKMKDDSLVMEDRLFLGKAYNKDIGLFINDKKGNPRIKIYIDDKNNSKFEFLDDKGKIMQMR